MSSLNTHPLLSFIVLSYNYEEYIAETIKSILAQSVGDFEIVVVDDASTDNSRSVIEGFSDPRIRLFCNEKNLGGTRSYNRAVEQARGEWLVNLDADDWITPDKSAKQLAALASDPRIDIIGTHVSFFDGNGAPHPNTPFFEGYANGNFDFNLLDTWIDGNRLCRSSTMVRRSAHLKIGLDDPDMVRAPDYELWTRALRLGCRFGVVPEKLTAARIQSKGVTHGDPLGTTLERAWIGIRNLRPYAEARAAWPSFEKLVAVTLSDPNLASLNVGQRHRLSASLFMDLSLENFSQYKQFLNKENPELEAFGKRMLAFYLEKGSRKDQVIDKLMRDITLFIEARDYWMKKSQNGHVIDKLNNDIRLNIEGRDYWKRVADGKYLKSAYLRGRRLVSALHRRLVAARRSPKR